MHFKLIIAFVDVRRTVEVTEAARQAGATGATVISHARGEGCDGAKTFLGLDLEAQRDMLLFLVEEHLCRSILETVAETAAFGEKGGGIAFQVDVEDAVGLGHQVEKLSPVVEEKL